MFRESAGISDIQAMSINSFNSLDKELNYLSYDDASLFAVLNNRLDDFEYHLLNDKQSIVIPLER
ncbi:hypothetical protein C0W96_14530 [Photobacterium kishitanii]|nr:hypothetical protein UB40_08370 [Photobacterium kishitanii]PSV05241.1 hypothetical protein C0W96_14530 [Photobacterium kishitanii]PSV76061.1 hypothetical protein C0W29_09550 [Photobacterium kishitanii]